ncbi:ead/Ea22-like family protein [Klebsiella quasipneumoniae]|uniref:ead/Ea22-like family protein n=1 Tax=Klebsiella quasipneumoniae TaxID=1463165 RepID=UPI0021695D56|nr:ead/Ea22-like family protein [Klebsiella quasipneumoniae]MCS4375055.1 ead/Ea22-like family protein [Klebsiella quasipneumoniae subsp. similipneumoniae]MCS4418088.1 ead/Ea22-like family protein [Klebsiella quasipneumoniae subsp. similipneumoniae]
MTTDITELAQSLKAAAENATQGNWRAFKYHDGRCGIGGGHHDEIMVCEHISKRRPHDAEFIALANPANVLALVEALEKAQQRIVELESRTVTVRLPDPPGPMSVGARTVYFGIVDDVVSAFQYGLNAAGIKVEVE